MIKKFLMFLFATVICLSILSCMGADKKRTYSNFTENTKSFMKSEHSNQENYRRNISRNINHSTTNDDMKDRIKQIANAVSIVDGVKESSVTIIGNTAIIGICLDYAVDDGDLVSIKRMIENEVKKTDNEIDHVSITASPDLVERIRKMQIQPENL